MSRLRLFAVTAVVTATLACGSSGPQQVATPTAPTPQSVAGPPVVLNENVQDIAIGQVFRGTLRGDGAYCIRRTCSLFGRTAIRVDHHVGGERCLTRQKLFRHHSWVHGSDRHWRVLCWRDLVTPIRI
jgi:hypothetical protein